MRRQRFSKRFWLLVTVLAIVALAQLACLGSATDTTQTEETEPVVEAPLPTDTFVGGECDAGTSRIELNASTAAAVVDGAYPDSCEVYCLWAPEGSQLEIGISGFNVDLDMYVDSDLTVLAYSDHGMWESNAFGTVDEQVTISDPDGRYYIQVCSYEGLASSFNIWSEFTP